MLNNIGGNQQINQPRIAIDRSFVERAIKIVTKPVYDFFTEKPEEIDISKMDIAEEIQKIEYNAAVFTKNLNDFDPKSRSKFNIVI